MVGVEIPDRDAFGAEVGVGVERGDGDLVEITKSHGGGRRGVMPRRAHEGECGGASGERVGGGGETGGDGTAGVVVDPVEIGRVGVEIAGLSEALEVGSGVGQAERVIGNRGRGRRETKFPVGVRGAEVSGGAGDPGRLLGAHGGAVVGALGVVENEHGGEERDGRKKAREAQAAKLGNAEAKGRNFFL